MEMTKEHKILMSFFMGALFLVGALVAHGSVAIKRAVVDTIRFLQEAWQ